MRPGRIGMLAVVLLAGTLGGSSWATVPAGSGSVLGRWLTRDGDGVFQIDRCGDALCGRLVGMRYSGSMPLDVHHTPQCNQQLIRQLRPAAEPGRWTGSITDPDSGDSYRATVWSPLPDTLKLRGYVLLPIFGQTQNWSRYRGRIGPACKLPG